MAVVIKVKYAGILRRFNVPLGNNGEVTFTMTALRQKISELFHLSPDVQFSVTYVDEDGDCVTMEEDNDLLDALNQCINPLRLEVSVKNQGTANGGNGPQERSSNPTAQTEGREQFQESARMYPSAEEILKAIPNMIGNAASTFGLASSGTRRQGNEQYQEFDFSNICPEEALRAIPDAVGNAVAKFLSENQVLRPSGFQIAEMIDQVSKLINPNMGPPRERQHNEGGSGSRAERQEGAANVERSVPVNTEEVSAGDGPMPMNIGEADDSSKKTEAGGENRKHSSNENKNEYPWDNANRTFHRGVQCDCCGMFPIIGPRFKSLVKENYDLCQKCFSEVGNDMDYTRLDRALYRPMRPCRERFHGLRPYPRATSFHQRPVGPASAPFPYMTPNLGEACPAFPAKPRNVVGKLDSRFVQDVTIFDGTALDPGTPFAKIWRLRNNGTLPWPHETKLVRVGGDDLRAGDSVTLQIGEEGHPVDAELDVVVDFVAPMQPGRYVSYWRFQSPSGQKFGQRVWVLIQVLRDPTAGFPLNMHSPSLFYRDPIAFTIQKPSFSHDKTPNSSLDKMDVDEVASHEQEKQDISVEEKRFADLINLTDEPKEFGSKAPIDIVSSATGNSPSSAPKEMPGQDDGMNVQPTAPAMTLGTDVPMDITLVEQTLLGNLEDMGFMDVPRNLSVLRKNDNDVTKAVEELCGASDHNVFKATEEFCAAPEQCAVSEWDPILEELEEMGFRDADKNKKLLKENEGSVKKVVLELLTANNNTAAASSGTSSSGTKKAKQS